MSESIESTTPSSKPTRARKPVQAAPKAAEPSPTLPVAQPPLVTTQVTNQRILAKHVQIFKQFEMTAMQQNFHSRKFELEVTPVGVKIISKSSKRIILIPYANILGIELLA
jgi:hypothetical protein